MNAIVENDRGTAEGGRGMIRKLTEPQLRALKWLSTKWTKADKSISSAVHSLQLWHRDLVEERTGPYGPRGGYCIQFRLTDAGFKEQSRRL